MFLPIITGEGSSASFPNYFNSSLCWCSERVRIGAAVTCRDENYRNRKVAENWGCSLQDRPLALTVFSMRRCSQRFFFLLTIQGKEIGWCNKVSSWVRFQSCEKKTVADRVSGKWEECWEKQIKVNIVFQGSDSIESLIVHGPDALQILFCKVEL